MIDHLVRHPNIYTDTAGVRRFDMLEQAVQRAGPGKIIFGTDGPRLHPAVELTGIFLLTLQITFCKIRALRVYEEGSGSCQF
jgi:predicted TIM-barrel fold metal-dependent hydrolase